MKFEDYKFKKGDKVSFTFTYPKNHKNFPFKNFEGTFKKYNIIDNNGFFLKFGPINIKKSKVSYIMADIEYINEYSVKILFSLQGSDLESLKLIE
jgi:hypothetical protein